MKMLLLVACLLIFTITVQASAAENPNIDPIRNVIEQFLYSEFNGNEASWCDYAWLSPKRITIEKKKWPDMVDCVINELPYAKLIIVESYKIDKIELLSKKSANAIVTYKRVAKTVGENALNRKIVPEVQGDDIVNYKIVKINNKWKIVDPEIPRVSVKSMLIAYEDLLKDRDEKWLSRSDITEEQKEYYNNYKNAHGILKEIDLQTHLPQGKPEDKALIRTTPTQKQNAVNP